mgnify:FL=1
MWYERDFTIPVFCKKVRFEYDRKTGNYTGKFKISEHQSQKIIEKLEYCKERASEANKKNSIKNEENLDSLSPGVLNCTYVWNFMLRYDYEKEEWEITADSEEQTYFDLEYQFLKYEKRSC